MKQRHKMKYIHRVSILLTLISLSLTYYTPISIAQDKTNLPEGALARLGKGFTSEIAYSPDGMELAIASASGIWIYDTTTFQNPKLLKKQKMHPEHIAYKPDGNLLAVYNFRNDILLWDTKTGTNKPQMGKTDIPHISNIILASAIAFSADRQAIAANDITGKEVNIFDVETGEKKIVFQRGGDDLINLQISLAFSPDGFLLAVGDKNGIITLLDTVTGEVKQEITSGVENPQEPRAVVPAVNELVFSPDGRTLVSRSSDSVVRMWNPDTGEQIGKLAGSIPDLNQLVFSEDSSLIAAGDNFGNIYVWDANTGAQLKTFSENRTIVTALAFSPDLRTIASSSRDGSIRIWNIITGQLMQTVADDYIGYTTYDISPDGNKIVSLSHGINSYIWDTTTGELQDTNSTNNIIFAIDFAFSPDGSTYAMTQAERSFMLLDLDTNKRMEHDFEHLSQVVCVAFSPDGKLIASGTKDKTAHIWDATTGEEKLAIRHGLYITDVAFSPDGKTLATAGNVRNIYLWDVEMGKRRMVIRRHKSDISSVAYSPDGTLLALGSKSGDITIYDVDTMKPLKSFVGDHEVVAKVRFTADGKRLVSLESRDFRARYARGAILYMWDIGALR